MRPVQVLKNSNISNTKDVKKVLKRTLKQDPSDLVIVFSVLEKKYPLQMSDFLQLQNGMQWIIDSAHKANSKKSMLILSGLQLYLNSSSFVSKNN